MTSELFTVVIYLYTYLPLITYLFISTYHQYTISFDGLPILKKCRSFDATSNRNLGGNWRSASTTARTHVEVWMQIKHCQYWIAEHQQRWLFCWYLWDGTASRSTRQSTGQVQWTQMRNARDLLQKVFIASAVGWPPSTLGSPPRAFDEYS